MPFLPDLFHKEPKAAEARQELEIRQQIAAIRMLTVAEYFVTTYPSLENTPTSLLTQADMDSLSPINQRIRPSYGFTWKDVLVHPLTPTEIRDGLVVWQKAIDENTKNFRSDDLDQMYAQKKFMDASNKFIVFFQELAEGRIAKEFLDEKQIDLQHIPLPHAITVNVDSQPVTIPLTALTQVTSELATEKEELHNNAQHQHTANEEIPETIEALLLPFLYDGMSHMIGRQNPQKESYGLNNPMRQEDLTKLEELSHATLPALEVMTRFLLGGGAIITVEHARRIYHLAVPLSHAQQTVLKQNNIHPYLETTTLKPDDPRTTPVLQAINQGFHDILGTNHELSDVLAPLKGMIASSLVQLDLFTRNSPQPEKADANTPTVKVQLIDASVKNFLVGNPIVQTPREVTPRRWRKKEREFEMVDRRESTDFVSIPYQTANEFELITSPFSIYTFTRSLEEWIQIFHESKEGEQYDQRDQITYNQISKQPIVVDASGNPLIFAYSYYDANYVNYNDETHQQHLLSVHDLTKRYLTELAALYGTMYPTKVSTTTDADILYQVNARRQARRLAPYLKHE